MNEYIFTVFVFGVIAIVAIAYRESGIAEKAISGIVGLIQAVVQRVAHVKEEEATDESD